MADEQIRISIGAIENASIDRVFGNARRKAERAAKDVSKAFQRGTKEWADSHEKVKSAAARAATSVAKSAKQAAREEERAAKSASKEKESAEKAWSKEFERESKRRLRISQMELRQRTRDHRAALRAQLTEERRAQRESERSARRSAGIARRDASRLSHRATRFFWPNMPMMSIGRRVAGDIARGVGLDTEIGSPLARARDLESQANNLSNAGIVTTGPAGDPNRLRVRGNTLMHEARAGGANYGFTSEQTLGALQQFQKPTGDLATGRKTLESMLRLSAAYGADPTVSAGAYGAIANALEGGGVSKADMPKQLHELAKVFIGQGKLGAIEWEDFASYGSRIASTATQYEGDITSNLKDLGAIAQAARAFGGADSAAMSATAVARLATTLSTNARVAEFKSAGIETMGEGGKFRNPVEIIKEALVATRDDPTAFNKLFMNIMGARGAQGLGSLFRTARGKASKEGASDEQATAMGLAAIDKFIQEQRDAQVSEKEIEDNLAEKRKETNFLVNQLNIELEKAGSEFLRQFVPALQKAAPTIKDFVEKLGQLSTWVVNNPKTAIAAALGLSIARAGLETVFRSAIERAILGSGTAIGAGASAGLKGALLGSSAVIAAAAGTALLVAIGAHEESKRRMAELAATSSEQDKVRRAAEDALVSGDPRKIEAAKTDTARAIDSVTAQAALRERRGVNLMMGAPAAAGGMMPSMVAQEVTEFTVLKGEVAKSSAILGKIAEKLSGTLKVNVANQPATNQKPQ